jgi:hypothetical protein
LFIIGKLDDSILQYFEEFTKEVPVNVKSRLIFSRTIPYLHLFNAQKIELLVLGSWILAQLSLTGITLSDSIHWTINIKKILSKVESFQYSKERKNETTDIETSKKFRDSSKSSLS